MFRVSRVSLSLLVFFAFVDHFIIGRGEAISYEDHLDDNRLRSEFNEFLQWRRSKSTHSKKFSAPPPVDEPALMGRYIVNQADWTAVGTISTRNDMFSFPMVNVKSVSDGPLGHGSGIPYIFLSPFDFTAKDLEKDNRATLLMTLAEGSYCKHQGMDPMDPRCARIILGGRIVKVDNSTSEYEVAKNAVFGRHPWLAHMPEDHHFFFAKLDIASIAVIDTFGGAKYVSVEDYMNPPVPEKHDNSHKHKKWFDEFPSDMKRFVLRI